ncbi:MAG: response regulator [Alphaproteobacteria bacterium]
MAAKRLLVADDRAEFAELVREVGLDLGYTVEVTTDARLFKETYTAFNPDVIALDMVMPHLDGVELVQWLAEQNCTARLILMTGFNPNYVRLAKALGEGKGLRSVTTLTKPMKIARLSAALDGSHDD